MTNKSDKTKQVFLETADRLFSKNGYDNVNVSTICKAAGKAKGLFFYHFDKKENIVLILLEKQVKAMTDQLTDVLSSMPCSNTMKMDFLMNVLVSKETPGPGAIQYFKESNIPSWVDLYTQSLRDKYVFPIILSVVQSGIEEGEFNYCSPESVEIIYLGISQFIHTKYSRFHETAYYKKTVEAISRTLETALGKPIGSINIK